MPSNGEKQSLYTLRQIVEELSRPLTGPDQFPQRLALCADGLRVCDQEKDPLLQAAFRTQAGCTLLGDPGETRPESIEQAIELFHLALTLTTKEVAPAAWAKTTVYMAAAYRNRFHGDPAENLEHSIACYEAALTVFTLESRPMEWAGAKINLANAVGDRIYGKRAENLERAIALYEEALAVSPPERYPMLWAIGIMNLACTYVERIRGERTENLARAITLFNTSLLVTRREVAPLDWAKAKLNMGNAYAVLALGDREQNLQEAIRLYNEVLTVVTRETMPVQWAQTAVNLANTYVALRSGDRSEHLETSIALYQAALAVIARSPMPIYWATVNVNLGNAYRHRIQGERTENQRRAISLYEAALTVRTREAFPLEWAQITKNLGIVYLERLEGEREKNLDRTIALYRDALTVLTIDAVPLEHGCVNADLGDLFLGRGDWRQAIAAYQSSLEALDIVLEATATPEAWLTELQSIEHVPVRLAYSLLRQDNPHPIESLMVLERWRVRSMGEALKLNEAALGDLEEKERLLLETARTELNELHAEARLPEGTPGRMPYTELAVRLRLAKSKLRQTVEQIRSYSPEFLPSPQLKDVFQCAAIGPLVYLLSTRAGGFALVISGHGEARPLEVIPLPLLDDQSFSKEMNHYWNLYRVRNQTPSSREHRNALDRLLKWLWDAAMKDLVPLLSPNQVTVLIPTGFLASVPLHAAWTEDPSMPAGRRYALDAGIITYSPSARILASAAGKAAIEANSVLAIDEPQNLDLPALPNSSREIAAVLSHFDPGRTLLFRHEQATRKNVMETCKNYSVLHFSCHAAANLNAPLDSGLMMADDEWLTLRDLLGLRMQNARLAVLSACETGLPGVELPEEAIGLPVGLLQAGVAGVIASMWSVSDASTMMLMVRFYDLWRREKFAPTAALRQAQLWVRDTTNQEKADYFNQSSGESNPRQHRMPSGLVTRLLERGARIAPHNREFAHPYEWAGFSYFGA